MKNVLIGLLVCVVALSATPLFAEGQKEETSGMKTGLHIQVYQDNPGQHEPTQALVQEWAEMNNEDVEVTVVTNATRLTGVTTALESGAGPDILVLYNVEGYQFSDQLLDITDLGNRLGEENGGWYPVAETYGKVDGEWKFFPVYLLSQMLLYRNDFLDEANVSVPSTWPQFRRALEQLKSRKPDVLPFGISLGRSFDGQQLLLARVMANGGKVLSDDGSEIVWDSPETVEALEYLIALVEDGLMNTDVLSWDDGTNNQAFLSGQIAMTFNSNSIKLQAQREFKYLNDRISTAVVPGGVSYPSPSGFAIRKSTEEPERAKDLLGHILSREGYGRTLEETFGAIGSAFKGFEDHPVWSGDNVTNLRAIPTAQIPAPPSAELSEAYNNYVFVDMVADVLDGGMTPEEAVARAADRLEAIYFGQ